MDRIRIRGARTHNLANIDLDLPRERLIVFTGISGSGKSSLAFDTLYAEGQRRYVETFSAYARQFLERLDPFIWIIIFLLGATAYGRDVAGRLAVMLRTGLTADCSDLELDPDTGLLLGEVSGFGGGILATIKCEKHRPQMATVRPGVFPEVESHRETPAAIERISVDLPESACPVRVVARHRREGVDVARAERLVIAGAGIHGEMGPVEELARALDAEIGATRVAVDEGWATRDRQIGQTGVVARPKLAVVCGASGATQFTVGIEAAGLVVALNQDPEAPIFEQADLCVVDDMFPVLRALIAKLQSQNGGAS